MASAERRPTVAGAPWFALILLLALTGCGTGAVTMNLQPTAQRRPAAHATAAVVRARIVPCTQETAGVLFGRALKPEGLDALLRARLEALGNRHYQIAVIGTAPNPTDESVELTVSYEKAYVQTLHDTKTGVVVLRVEHAGRTLHLRGQDTGLNWWGTGDEMAAALTTALDRALVQLRPVLAECGARAAGGPAH